MIVRALPTATARVDERTLAFADPGEVLAVVRHNLDRQMDAWALECAVDVPMLSRWYEEQRLDDSPWGGLRCAVTWAPDPARGCQFHRGPLDGEELGLPRGPGGRPPRYWTVASPLALAPPYSSALVASPAALSIAHTTYALAGVNPATDQWVYEA